MRLPGPLVDMAVGLNIKKMKKSRISRSLNIVLIVAVAVVLLAVFVWRWQQINQERKSALHRIRAQVNNASQSLDVRLSVLKEAGDKFAARITERNARFSENNLKRMGNRVLTSSKCLDTLNSYSIAVVFHPEKYKAGLKLFAPIWVRQGSRPKYRRPFKYAPHAKNSYDYITDREKGAWYEPSISKAKNRWVAQWGTAVGDYVLAYRAPFFRLPDKKKNQKEKEEVGFVMITMTIAQLRDIVASLSIARGGYAVLTMQNGRLLYHPDSGLISRDTSRLIKNLDLKEIAKRENNALLAELARPRAIQKDCLHDYDKHRDPVTEEEVLIIGCRMKQTGLNFQAVVVQEEAYAAERNLSRVPFIIIALLVLGLLAILFALCYFGDTRHSFSLSTGTSILMSAGLIALCTVVNLAGDPPEEHRRIYHQSDLYNFQSDHTARISDQYTLMGKSFQRAKHMHYIPTGVFIKSIELTPNKNVALKGFVWQHYGPSHMHLAAKPRGFRFPDAITNNRYGTETATYKNSFIKGGQKFQVFGWEFRTVIRQNFDYRHYPIDRHEIRLHLRYLDILNKNVYLAPMLDSYAHIQAARKPGLEHNLEIPAFELRSSYYMYIPYDYNADFGIEDFRRKDVEELYFVIKYRRKLLKPVVRHLLPIAIMIFILFFVLAAITNHREKIMLFGSNLVGIVVACASVFFVAVSNHLALRSQLTSDTVIYGEMFYLLLYLAILYIPATAFIKIYSRMFEPARFITWLNYKERGPKMNYFPFLTTLGFVWTLMAFFPASADKALPPETPPPEISSPAPSQCKI